MSSFGDSRMCDRFAAGLVLLLGASDVATMIDRLSVLFDRTDASQLRSSIVKFHDLIVTYKTLPWDGNNQFSFSVHW